jgi:hypothetical protein
MIKRLMLALTLVAGLGMATVAVQGGTATEAQACQEPCLLTDPPPITCDPNTGICR